ncbi:hypothetical protein [Stappia sp.]
MIGILAETFMTATRSEAHGRTQERPAKVLLLQGDRVGQAHGRNPAPAR